MWRLAGSLLLSTTLHAQSVSGTLSDSITRAPIPNVIVTLLGPTRYHATTDEAGTFHIAQVRPGKYILNIVKAGYVLPASRGRPFQVDSDLRLGLEMDPLGRVEGRVRYPDGRPAPRASVSLTGAGHNYTAVADAGGRFLVEDVAPGSYVLRAAGAPGDPKAEGEIWAPTYFPSTIDRAAAEAIPVSIGVTAARDVRLRSVAARRVGGVVRDEGGELAGGVSVRLEQQTVVTNSEGEFSFVTRDGEWRLEAARKDADCERRGFATVMVSRHDVENVLIRLAAPFSIPLIIERDDVPAAGQPRFPVMVLLSRLDGVPSLSPITPEGARNFYPGRYTVLPPGVPGSYVESIQLGAMDVYGRPFDLVDGSQPIRVTLRRGGGSVRGTVGSGETATVVVIEAGESAWGTRMAPVANGRFDVGSLRPGDYYVVAVDRPMPISLTEAIRRALLGRAERVHLDKGSVVTVSLKATPLP